MKKHIQPGAIACIAGGLLLSLLSVPALIYGVRATRAFPAYHRARWRSEGVASARLLDLCARAHAQYPHNYRLSVLAAKTAFAQGRAGDDDKADALLQAAEDWCDTGLEQNPVNTELREIKARLIAYGSDEEAVEYWERYLDWHFWTPVNHAVMVDLSVNAGNLSRAEAALKWLEGSQYHATAKKRIEEARRETD